MNAGSLTGREDAMILALPGAGEPANFYCNVFSAGRYSRLARQRGYLLVCLSGIGTSIRQERQEQQILALRDELLSRYPSIKKVFLTGYSIGGRGALMLALRHPDKFNGVAAVVPWMRMPKDGSQLFPEMQRRMVDYPHEVFVISALFDFFFPFSRKDMERLAVAGEGRVHRRRYPADHWLVVSVSAKDMFDFFDAQRSPTRLAWQSVVSGRAE